MKEHSVGTVYLVGAGPGDPDLITIKGRELLERADAIVYDNLIPLELVVTLPETVERHYVGKQASLHALPQEEISLLLVKLAKQGKNVVRLKGGDPCMFGRGGEEGSVLRANDVPFEIVPGVTAGTAALAYAGIPPTDRRKASTVIYATGHRCVSRESLVNWSWIAKSHDTTVVIYMGVKELPEIVKKLREDGMSADMPAAVIEKGTYPTQRVVTGTITNLYDRAEAAGIKPPSLIVIGDVVELRDELCWYGKTPLIGKRVLVARPADQAADVYRDLRRLGAEVLPYPTLATRSSLTEPDWDRVSSLNTVTRWLVFTSENGVRYFLPEFLKRIGDVRRLSQFHIAAVGYGTKRILQQFNITPDFVPTVGTTAELGKQLCEQWQMKGASVVRVRGNLGDDRVERALGEAGAEVMSIQSYETYTPEWPENLKSKLQKAPPDYVLFTSGSSCDGFVANLTKEEIGQLGPVQYVSIGPTTSDIIRGHGLEVAVEAADHSVPGVVKALVEQVSGNYEPVSLLTT